MNTLFTIGRRPANFPGWTSLRLKDASRYVNRGVAPTYAEAGAELVAVSQKCVIGNGQINLNLGRPMEDHGEASTEARLIAGDIVVNSTGTGTLGRVGMVDLQNLDSTSIPIADGHVTIIRVDETQALPEFMNYLFGTDTFSDFANECLAVGSTNQMELGRESLRSLGIRLPDVSEQRRIVSFLQDSVRRIDEMIFEQEHLVKLLWERRSAATFDAVTGRLVPGSRTGGVAWVESIPASWKAVKLTQIARLGSGHTPARNRPELWIDCTIPWITTGEVSQVRSDEREVIIETRECVSTIGIEESSAVLHPAGTVVLCRTASAGFSAIMGTDMATSQDFATWTCGPDLDQRFLLYCLRAMRKDLLERLAMGSTHQTIYMPDIKSITIPLPSIQEQKEIVVSLQRAFQALDTTRLELHKQTQLLRERREVLITSAVTGQLNLARSFA